MQYRAVRRCRLVSRDSPEFPTEHDKDTVGGIKLKEEPAAIDADVVILGVGVAPETTYLKDSGWQLERDGSVLVDETFAVHGRQNLYAIGALHVCASPT